MLKTKRLRQAKTPARGGGSRTRFSVVLMCGGLGSEDAGVLTHIELVPHVFGALVAIEERTQDHGEEAEWNRNQAGVAQIEQRLFQAHQAGFLAGELRALALRA